jgi:hypothetical protein
MKFVILILTVLGESLAKPVENFERMMLRKRMDQDHAASSYVYRSDNNGPTQVYYLTADDLSRNYHHKPSPLVYYESSPLTVSNVYASAYPTSSYPAPKPKQILPPFKPSPLLEEYVEPRDDSSSSSGSSSSSEESHEGGANASKANFSHQDDDHSEEGGKSHDDKYNKKHGEKSNKGYKNELKFSKGKKGSYDKKYDAGNHEEEGDKKSSKYDESDNYHEHHSKDHKKKGGKYGSKKHHKKGSKSKGYHNVFMKDEYKKDHTFYGKLNL